MTIQEIAQLQGSSATLSAKNTKKTTRGGKQAAKGSEKMSQNKPNSKSKKDIKDKAAARSQKSSRAPRERKRDSLKGDNLLTVPEHEGARNRKNSTSSDNSNNSGDSDKVSYKMKFKTELCKNWEIRGTCKFGDQCAFAHGRHELRYKVHIHDNYRTKKCKSFHSSGYCIYGSRCQFIHSENHSSDINERKRGQENFYQFLLEHREHQICKKLTTLNKEEVLSNIDDPAMSYREQHLSHERPRLSVFKGIAVAH